MKITPSLPNVSALEAPGGTQPHSPDESAEAAFSQYLQAFDVAGKARVKADMTEKSEQFDAMAWMLRVRQLGLYTKARDDLMAERNLDHHDFDAMSDEERVSFESQVYSRVRDELVLRMKDRHRCPCDEEEIRLYRAAPFLISG
ncbi:hypothetical protein [Kordiimonas lacus]|uniref:Uncharacterized protein n=1 Tax=Kordiimonas lacus TaxID=637679 RepID=A0A1G6XZ67_9PROT|nr:hypothetical protein [Kordiimonas lacus]SDD82973.1 hypothetical protein SAMN04488071_1408 [Kordiimonas lacus]